jgi:glycosyltransferase involved in cell wall biosynthesis
VHTHDLYSNLLGVPAAWLAGTRTIISSRRDLGSWWWYTKRNRKILRLIQSLSSSVVANSQAVKDLLVKQDGFAATRIHVIHNGVELERFRLSENGKKELEVLQSIPKSHKKVVLVANMHVETKGHKCLIQAAKSVCNRVPEVTFVLVGDGELRPKFEQQIAELNLRKNFLFLGTRNDVPEILAACDLGLLCSLAEGLPNAVLEYLAAGLPVVATSVGGVPEIIEHGVNGLLVPPSDTAALASAILEILQDTELASAMRRRAREVAIRKFSFDRLISELEQLYGYKQESSRCVVEHSVLPHLSAGAGKN